MSVLQMSIRDGYFPPADELYDKIMQIVKAAQKSPTNRHSDWINFKGTQLYARATRRSLDSMDDIYSTIEVASITLSVRIRGRKVFTDTILATFEKIGAETGRAVFIENVQEERFKEFFRRIGYTEILFPGSRKEDPSNFYKK